MPRGSGRAFSSWERCRPSRDLMRRRQAAHGRELRVELELVELRVVLVLETAVLKNLQFLVLGRVGGEEHAGGYFHGCGDEINGLHGDATRKIHRGIGLGHDLALGELVEVDLIEGAPSAQCVRGIAGVRERRSREAEQEKAGAHFGRDRQAVGGASRYWLG